jgi:hypothetical protein
VTGYTGKARGAAAALRGSAVAWALAGFVAMVAGCGEGSPSRGQAAPLRGTNHARENATPPWTKVAVTGEIRSRSGAGVEGWQLGCDIPSDGTSYIAAPDGGNGGFEVRATTGVEVRLWAATGSERSAWELAGLSSPPSPPDETRVVRVVAPARDVVLWVP